MSAQAYPNHEQMKTRGPPHLLTALQDLLDVCNEVAEFVTDVVNQVGGSCVAACIGSCKQLNNFFK